MGETPTHTTTARRRLTLRTAIAATTVAAAVALAGCAAPAAPGSERPSPPAAVEVSGQGVDGLDFGTGRSEVVAALSARLGEPDTTDGPTRFSRIPGHDGWFEVAGDNISPAWAYEYAARTCWGDLCLVFGGQRAEELALRGWALAHVTGTPPTQPSYDVRVAGSGLRLGDTWAEVREAYPNTVVDGGEGASLAIRDLPWPAFTDGVGAWRLSGNWDFEHPHRAPADAQLIRISAGEGPEPGCC